MDLRLIAGIIIVVGSLLVGARLFASASHTERIWAASHHLSAGEVLVASDLHAVDVRLADVESAYFPSGSAVFGQTLTREVASGELLPRSALGATPSRTTVTIPLSDDNAPKIHVGDRITLWVSTKDCPSAVVLADVVVQDVQSTGSSFAGGEGNDVTVRVPADDAQRVVEAQALDGAVLRAGILSGTGTAAASLPDLTACAAPGS